jgi:predicted dehydrogenase
MEADMKKTRLGIIGPGLIWDDKHKPAIGSLGDLFSIKAFSASSEKSKEKISREYPGTPFYKDYRDLILSDIIDAVVVLTPIGLNAKVSMAALAAGKDVIVEKPMAASSTEARALIKKEKKTGKKVIILEQNVYKQSVKIIQEIISSGRLGKIISYERTLHFLMEHKKSGPEYNKTAWRQQPDFMLGIFFDAGIHDLAELSMLFGNPDSVYAEGVQYGKKFGPYDQISALIKYPDDINGFFSFSSITGDSRNYFTIRGTKGLIHIENEEIIIEDNRGKKEKISVSQENVHLGMWKKIKLFLDGKELPYYTTSVSHKDIEVMEAIDKSLKSSCSIPVQ